jgi:hypothetical protein
MIFRGIARLHVFRQYGTVARSLHERCRQVPLPRQEFASPRAFPEAWQVSF